MNERCESNLLAYARGELTPDELAWMEEYLSQNPDDRIEVNVLKELYEAMSAEAAQAQRGSEEGLDALRAKFIQRHQGKSVTGGQFAGIRTQSSPRALLNRVWGSLAEIRARIPIGRAPTLSVHFTPNASEAEIRTLLQQLDGRIVNGPDSDAFYSVRIYRRKPSAALEECRWSPIVDEVFLRSPKSKK